MNIEDLELTFRSHKGLAAAGITTVDQLVKLDWQQLQSIKNLGKKSVAEICWTCIQLLNGRMLERQIEWDKEFPKLPKNAFEKIRKYDAIAKIINDNA